MNRGRTGLSQPIIAKLIIILYPISGIRVFHVSNVRPFFLQLKILSSPNWTWIQILAKDRVPSDLVGGEGIPVEPLTLLPYRQPPFLHLGRISLLEIQQFSMFIRLNGAEL